ncbi:MAG: ATP-binding protein [Magnetospirillum sp. WYHS-4]
MPGLESEPTRPSHARTWVVMTAWFAVAASVAGWFWVNLLAERDEILVTAHRQVQSRALLAAEHAARLFEGVDLALRHVTDWIGPDPAWERIGTSWDDWEHLQRMRQGLGAVPSLSLVDGNGRFRLHTDSFPVPERSVADRPYFLHHKTSLDPGPFFQEPLTGRVVSRPVLVMSRRLSGDDGRFAGLAVAAIKVAALEESLAALIQASGDHITLMRMDGMILLRHPPSAATAPRQVPITPWVLTALAAGKKSDTAERPSPVDGVHRIFAFQKIGNYDLIAVAGMAKQEILAEWHAKVKGTVLVLGSGFLLLTLLLGGLLRLYGREAAARARAEAAERRLSDSVAELSRSNAELERFAYVAAHDLQEPLRNVVTYSQILEKRMASTLDETGRENLAVVVDGARRMRQLVGDLLTYSRVTGGAEAFAPVDTKAALAMALTNLKEATGESHARIGFSDLPTVAGDRTQLALLFQNLVGNAIKYRRPGNVPSVDIHAELRDGWWWFSVTDDGIGIDPRYADQIFVIFKRLHTRDSYPGTGLGLALCRRIVERHGGRIWVESGGDGRGSTFRFTLPAG